MVLWWSFLASREEAFIGPKQVAGEKASMSLGYKQFRGEVVCSYEEQTPHFGGTRVVHVMSIQRLPRVSHWHILCLPITSLTETTLDTMVESACPIEMSISSSRKK
jgi:hypothetical protein